jgi:hypothetical protein
MPVQDDVRLLLVATERLIRDHSNLTAGQVIAAVAGAKISVREGYVAVLFDPLNVEDHVGLVINLARQTLAMKTSAQSVT